MDARKWLGQWQFGNQSFPECAHVRYWSQLRPTGKSKCRICFKKRKAKGYSLTVVKQCFEGLKAFRSKDGRIRVFRPHENGRRMNRTAAFGSMPEIPEEVFLQAIKTTVQANLEFVPPYGSGGSLYLRPLLFGSGPMIGLSPAPEFTFIVFGVPVANYYKDGVKPVDAYVIEDFDRCKLATNANIM